MKRNYLSVSIVVNTLDRVDHLRNLLWSFQHLRYPNFEVIVVNGPSEDGTAELLEHWSDRVRIGSCSEANLSKSRNVGIAMARGDIVAFIDDDAIPEPDWVNEIVLRYTDSEVGAVGGPIRDHSGYTFQCRYVVCDRLGDAVSCDSLNEARKSLEGQKNWNFLSQTGANSSFRRSVLLEVGGFDEEFAYFLDETDLNLRIVDAGYNVEYSEHAEVHHKYAPSYMRDERRVAKNLYRPARSKAYFVMRHASEQKSMDELYTYLSDYAVDIKKYNNWYLQEKWIDKKRCDELDEELKKGVMDGVRQAFKQTAPAFLSNSTIKQYADGKFLNFQPTKVVADRLRICFLSQEYPPLDCGGIGVWTHELAVSLARMGHEVSVVTKGHADHHTVDYEDGVWVHRIKSEWQSRRTFPPLPDIPQVVKDYAYTAFDEVVRIHLRRGLDIVSAPIWDLEGIACATADIVPTVISLHTTFKLALPFKPDWTNNPVYMKNHVEKIIDGEAFLIQRSKFILANSQAVIDDIEDAYDLEISKEKVITVPHGLPDRRLSVEPFKRNPGELRILFVGRMEPRKGADMLLEVLPGLMDQYDNLSMDIIGNDSIVVGKETLREAFEKKWSGTSWFGRVKFHGFVDEEALFRYYATCDVFVAPSRYESFGLIYLEAMMFGKACIGPDVGGVQEVIEHGKSGLLFETGNKAMLEAAMVRLIKSDDLRTQIGKAARERYSREFTLEIMAKRLETTYRAWARKKADK